MAAITSSITVTEPEQPDLQWPRYSIRPFPLYRFVPGRAPHPRRDPRGHSYGLPEPKPTPFSADQWHTSEDYLYGIDLYNFAYWWECHEVFEGLWHAVGHHSEQGNFFQALIQLAAANLKRFLGNEQAAHKLAHSGLARLQNLPQWYMGIDVIALSEACRAISTPLSNSTPYQILLAREISSSPVNLKS